MTEVKYSSHIYDLSIKRVAVPINLGGGSIKVLAVNGDCFIQLNDKSQDPINLLHVANIKTTFTKFYLSNNVQVGGYVAIIIGSREFELTTNIARTTHEPLLLPPQNIPEHLLGRVIDIPRIINVWDIENAVLRHKFNVRAQDGSPTGLFFNPDGLKVYTVGGTNDIVIEYDLSTAWDITTTVFRHSFSVALQTTNPQNLFFSSDGSFMYIPDLIGSSIFQYTLATKWDVTTATHTFTFNTLPETNSPTSVVFSPTGHKMYITDSSPHVIYEYDIPTKWDISTVVFKHSIDIRHKILSPMAMFISPDGLKCYVVGSSPTKVIAFRLLEAWNITSAIYKESFNYHGITAMPNGIFFNPTGSKMFMISPHNEDIYEFDL